MRLFRVITLSAVALLISARAYCVDSIFPSGASIAVSRTPDQLYLVPNTEVEVQVTIANNTGEALRGICYSEHIPSVFNVETIEVSIGGAPIADYIYEVSSDDIYSHTAVHRWIIEEPGEYAEMDNPLPPLSVLLISYRISATAYYCHEWPPYLFACERELPAQEYYFGYCDETLLINEDTDEDGMADVYELHYFLDLSHDGTVDGEGDGLIDLSECQYGSDPTDSDTDDDGLGDGDEVTLHGTNPVLYDTDGEGLSDGEEISTYNTNPVLPDTDSDDASDFEEVMSYGTDPCAADTDGDGLMDYWGEIFHDGDLSYDPYDPVSNPGGTDTDASKADTDGDAFSDYIEIGCGSNPLSESAVPPVIRINFQSSSSQCPEGYSSDSAGAFSPRGYGWL